MLEAIEINYDASRVIWFICTISKLKFLEFKSLLCDDLNVSYWIATLS
jgi:hypothetical protein